MLKYETPWLPNTDLAHKSNKTSCRDYSAEYGIEFDKIVTDVMTCFDTPRIPIS